MVLGLERTVTAQGNDSGYPNGKCECNAHSPGNDMPHKHSKEKKSDFKNDHKYNVGRMKHVKAEKVFTIVKICKASTVINLTDVPTPIQ